MQLHFYDFFVVQLFCENLWTYMYIKLPQNSDIKKMAAITQLSLNNVASP